jgi:hypothetical protein
MLSIVLQNLIPISRLNFSPINHSPVSGIQAASKVLRAGNVVPSPIPSKTRSTINQGAPPDNFKHRWRLHKKCIVSPHSIVIGVMSVKIAVDKMPKLSVYFPPNIDDKTPPGT